MMDERTQVTYKGKMKYFLNAIVLFLILIIGFSMFMIIRWFLW